MVMLFLKASAACRSSPFSFLQRIFRSPYRRFGIDHTSQRTAVMHRLLHRPLKAEEVDLLQTACAEDDTPAAVQAICSCKLSVDVCRVGAEMLFD